MAFSFQSQDWRLPGCGNTCHIKYVFLPGLAGREPLEYHDPEAHEAWGAAHADKLDVVSVFESGPLRVDLYAREVVVNGRLALIGRGEWDLLSILARHPGRRFSGRELAVLLRGPEYNDESGAHAFRMTVHRLRKHLGEAAYLLDSRQHIGYRLLSAPSALRKAHP